MKRLVLCLLCVCAARLLAAAHVLDQYEQVALIDLSSSGVRIELRLIPGIEVAERICTVIDADHDGQITKVEEQAYAQRVLQDLKLALNGVDTPMTLTDIRFPTQQEMREGLGTIRLSFATAATLGAADHQQLYFRNDHQPELGAYLVNALVPTTSEIKISGQERDPLQREIRLSFDVATGEKRGQWDWKGVLLSGLCLVLCFPILKRWRVVSQR